MTRTAASLAIGAAARILAGLAIGVALAAVQLLPLLQAGAQSTRTVTTNYLYWSMHPLSLAEVIAPGIFGDYDTAFGDQLPWMRALNAGRDPFFYSLYLGMPAIGLAICGLTARHAHRWLWLTVLIASVIGAFGIYTPIYPALLDLLPFLRMFRYPPKYFVFAVLAIAMLVAAGWDALRGVRLSIRPAIAVTAIVAIAGYLLALGCLVWPDAMVSTFGALADFVKVDKPRLAVASLLDLGVPHGARLFLSAFATGWLLFVATHAPGRPARIATATLFVAVAADLVITNHRVNSTTSIDRLARPPWAAIVSEHASQRFYFGGRLDGTIVMSDPDGPSRLSIPPASKATDVRAAMQSQIVSIPSGWGLRETVSYDLPALRSLDYKWLEDRLAKADRAERARFLSRTGTRYCVLPKPPFAFAAPLVDVPEFKPMSLYDCDPSATRVRVVPPWGRVEPNVRTQLDSLFRESFDFPNMILLDREPPPPAGKPGAGLTPAARLVRDGETRVDVEADVASGGGFLMLMDLYDDDWKVAVDGEPAPLLRADGFYRAVRLVPGRHAVSFRFRPRLVMYGAALSGIALLGCAACFVPSRRRREATAAVNESTATALDDVAATSVSGPASV